MISFERANGRRRPSRFTLATIVLPVVLVALSLPTNRVMGQYVAGRAVVDGSIEVSGTLVAMEALAWLLTAAAILAAVRTADTPDRPVTARFPAAAAGGALGLVIAAGGLSAARPALTIVLTSLLGFAIGALPGEMVARLVLDPGDRTVTADFDVSGFWSRVILIPNLRRPGVEPVSGDLDGVTAWQPAGWSGRVSSPNSAFWVVPLIFVALNLAQGDIAQGDLVTSPVAVAVTVFMVVTWVASYRLRSARLEIGSSGLLVRSAILERPLLAVEIDRFQSASVVEQGRSFPDELRAMFGAWWRYNEGRLTISNGRGPALLVTLADGAEILLATNEAENAVIEVNRHLP